MTAIDPKRTYASAEVARLLFGHAVEWFYTYRKTTGRAEGFPAPVSGRGHPRWLGASLLAWSARPRLAPAPKATADNPAPDNLVDIRAILRQRSAGIARRA